MINMNTPTFYTKISTPTLTVLTILGTVFNICTVGIFFSLAYDYFYNPKDVWNRKILYKYLKTNPTYSSKHCFTDIIEYKFDTFDVWYWTNTLQISAHTPYDRECIGLFRSSMFQDRKVIKIIRKLISINSKP